MKTKKKNINDSVIKAMKKANRELQFERNGGGQWVAVNRPHKNKKKYNRKRDKNNYDFSCPFFLCKIRQFVKSISFITNIKSIQTCIKKNTIIFNLK